MILVDLRSFMTNTVHISGKRLQLILGVLLSTFVLLQAIHTEPTWMDAQEQQDQADSSTDTDSESTVSLTQAIPNSASQINLAFESYLLNEVGFEEESKKKITSSELIKPRIHKAIRILLNRIVTPNAP